MLVRQGMLEWPQALDYNTAIQSPHLCFRDPDLSGAQVEKHPITRMPKLWTGGFADVYRLRNGNDCWAVKCFKRSPIDVRQRYAAISRSIAAAGLPYFVDFQCLDDEMLVNGSRYLVVKMRWADGQPLHEFIRARLRSPWALRRLAARLIEMVWDLERHSIGHGDIQHGNLLVRDGQLVLVDYDGMFVPEFEGQPSPEIGLANYQHPLRSPEHYGPTIDRFPLLVACTGLYALAAEPSLWEQFNPVDNESLLFTREDFALPDHSALFRRLRDLGDDQLAAFVEMLRSALAGDPRGAPLPEPPEVPDHEDAPSHEPASGPWWVSVQESAVRASDLGVPVQAAPVQAAPAWAAPPGIAASPGMGVAPTFVQVPAGSVVSVRKVALWTAVVASSNLALVGWLPLDATLALSVIVFSYLLSIRYSQWKQLPTMARYEELAQRLNDLDVQIPTWEAQRSNLERDILRDNASELREKETALKVLALREWEHALTPLDVSCFADVEGVNPQAIEALRMAGVSSLWDLYQNRNAIYAVARLEQTLRAALLARFDQILAGANVWAPKALPQDLDRSITAKYEFKRQLSVRSLASVEQRLAALKAERDQITREMEAAQRVSFCQFLLYSDGPQP